jgi:hypothetical protein
MVRQNPKEKLNNKAAKMIDLALDEVFMGGEKSITASFKDSRNDKKVYNLTVTVGVTFEEEATNTSNNTNHNCNCGTNTGDNTNTGNNDSTPVNPTTNTPIAQDVDLDDGDNGVDDDF